MKETIKEFIKGFAIALTMLGTIYFAFLMLYVISK